LIVAKKPQNLIKSIEKAGFRLSGLPNVGTIRPSFPKREAAGAVTDHVVSLRSVPISRLMLHLISGDSLMQKKLIALAIAGLASTAAIAQSNVTVYGRVDYGYVNRSSGDGASPANGTRSEFASGIEGGSRIGFKGSEDLGNGLKAIFELEYGIGVDSAGGATGATPTSSTTPYSQWWNRHSYVGLTGGFGTVVGGRVDGDRYSVINSYDPFGGGTVANAITAFGGGQVTRGDNAIAYISPDMSGFRVLTFYTTKLVGSEGVGAYPSTTGTQQNTGDLRGGGLNLEYANGPIRATVNYEKFAQKGISNTDVKVGEIAGSYDFGVAKVSALYDSVKTDAGNADLRNWLVGVSAPVTGSSLVRAVYTRHTDKNDGNNDYNKFGIGFQYKLSKRTDVFTDYARISNSSTAAGQIGFSGVAGSADYPAQTTGSTLYGTRGFDVGIAHTF
jgi:predicted porin